MAQPAYIAVMKIVGMYYKMPATMRTRCSLQHAPIEKAHQCPGSCKAQQGLHLAYTAVLQVELVALDNGLRPTAIAMLDQVAVNIGKYGGVNVRLPGQKPVSGKG